MKQMPFETKEPPNNQIPFGLSLSKPMRLGAHFDKPVPNNASGIARNSPGQLTHQNNFDLLRLLAAMAVVVSHSYDLFGVGKEPLRELGGHFTMGGVAVYVFFVMSGYLVTSSLMQSASVAQYFMKRCLRILPALMTVVLVTALIIGPLLSELTTAQYFAQPRTWLYLKSGILLAQVSDSLPGLFAHNPSTYANGSLWTLPFEFMMYVLLAVIFSVFRSLTVSMVLIVLLPSLAIGFLPWDAADVTVPLVKAESLRILAKFCYFFFAGVLLNRLSAIRPDMRVPHWLALLAFCLMVFFLPGRAAPFVFALAVPLLVWFFGNLPGRLLKNGARFGDFSYGIYLWGYPVQQVLKWCGFPQDFHVYTAVSLVLTTMLAAASWHFVESPALDLKRRFARG